MKPSTSLLLAALLLASPFDARAQDVVIGESCSALGTSTMATNQKDIAVCLKNDDGNLVWKSSTNASGGTPSGTIAFFALGGCPSGWVLANGSNGTIDLRGEFIRVADSGRGVDEGRLPGTTQGDTIRNITGSMSNVVAAGREGYPFSSTGAFSGSALTPEGAGPSYHGPDFYRLNFDASRVVPTSTEVRPRNVALIACQKS